MSKLSADGVSPTIVSSSAGFIVAPRPVKIVAPSNNSSAPPKRRSNKKQEDAQLIAEASSELHTIFAHDESAPGRNSPSAANNTNNNNMRATASSTLSSSSSSSQTSLEQSDSQQPQQQQHHQQKRPHSPPSSSFDADQREPLPTPVSRANNPMDRNSAFERQNDTGVFARIRKIRIGASKTEKSTGASTLSAATSSSMRKKLASISKPKATIDFSSEQTNNKNVEVVENSSDQPQQEPSSQEEDFEAKRARSRSAPESKKNQLTELPA
jgi:hypothetical protein